MSPDPRPRRVAVVLAAGKGTRMKSELPKVLHPTGGRPMLAWVVETARRARCERIVVVYGHEGEAVRAAVSGDELAWVLQEEQLGTGHALAQAEAVLEAEAGGEATLLVLSGDVPLVRPETLDGLAAAAETSWGALAVADLDEPGSLGRVLERDDGGLERIVEAADASPEELAVRRINAGLYALPAPEVFSYLARLDTDNAKGELYLTDALGAAVAAGERVAIYPLDDPSEAFGANTRADLARVHRRFLDRRAEELMDSGVSLLEPARTTIEPTAEVGPETVVHPGVALLGRSRVGAGCTLYQGAWLRDAVVGDGAVVGPYAVLDGARVAPGETVPAHAVDAAAASPLLPLKDEAPARPTGGDTPLGSIANQDEE